MNRLLLLVAFLSWPWVAIALILAPLILPGLQVSGFAVIPLSLVIWGIQAIIAARLLPLIPSMLIRAVFERLNPSDRWQDKLKLFVRSWCIWFGSTAIGYGTVWGLLAIASQGLPGVSIADRLTLSLAALLVFYFPQAAQAEFSEPLKTAPLKLRSFLAVPISVLTFPLIPGTIATLSPIIPNSGLSITPVQAAIAYALLQTMRTALASVFTQTQLSLKSFFPNLPHPRAFLDSLPIAQQFPWLILFASITLSVNGFFIWSSLEIVPGIISRYPAGLFTFAIATFIGVVIHGLILAPFSTSSPEE